MTKKHKILLNSRQSIDGFARIYGLIKEHSLEEGTNIITLATN